MLEKKYIEGLSTLMLYDLRHKNDFRGRYGSKAKNCIAPSDI